VAEVQKHLPEKTAVPFKKLLTWPEDTRNEIKRNIPFADGKDIVVPEFILDKYYSRRSGCPYKPFSIPWSIGRKVADIIGSLVIFPYLIA